MCAVSLQLKVLEDLQGPVQGRPQLRGIDANPDRLNNATSMGEGIGHWQCGLYYLVICFHAIVMWERRIPSYSPLYNS